MTQCCVPDASTKNADLRSPMAASIHRSCHERGRPAVQPASTSPLFFSTIDWRISLVERHPLELQTGVKPPCSTHCFSSRDPHARSRVVSRLNKALQTLDGRWMDHGRSKWLDQQSPRLEPGLSSYTDKRRLAGASQIHYSTEGDPSGLHHWKYKYPPPLPVTLVKSWFLVLFALFHV